jgi:hypothetical protein
MNERVYKKVKSILKDRGSRSSYIGEDDFVSLVKGGVTINFHIKNRHLDIENIFRAVKRAQKIVKDKFDYTLEKIDIDIYDSIDEMRQDGRSRSKYASWIAGIYDGKIRVISEKEDEEPESLYIILTHEIVHLVIDKTSGGLCPYWLDEGLAVYLSQEIPAHYFNGLQEAVKKDKVLPLELLERHLSPDADENIRQLAYSEVSSITEYLVETCGWNTIKSIICQCVRRPFKTILSDLSLNYYLLEQGWKRWLKGKSA